jgi:hypothetical protein
MVYEIKSSLILQPGPAALTDQTVWKHCLQRRRLINQLQRCAATQVNPATAERDLDIVAALEHSFDHTNMGVYAEVVAGGEIPLPYPAQPRPSPRFLRIPGS